MIAEEMEKILPFHCKYADGVKKRTPVSGLRLQTKGNHGIRDRDGEESLASYIFRYFTFLILSESHFNFQLKCAVS